MITGFTSALLGRLAVMKERLLTFHATVMMMMILIFLVAESVCGGSFFVAVFRNLTAVGIVWLQRKKNSTHRDYKLT